MIILLCMHKTAQICSKEYIHWVKMLIEWSKLEHNMDTTICKWDLSKPVSYQVLGILLTIHPCFCIHLWSSTVVRAYREANWIVFRLFGQLLALFSNGKDFLSRHLLMSLYRANLLMPDPSRPLALARLLETFVAKARALSLLSVECWSRRVWSVRTTFILCSTSLS